MKVDYKALQNAYDFLADLPPEEWLAWVSHADKDAVFQMGMNMAVLAEMATLATAYLDARFVGVPHEVAVDAANDALRHLRCGLGYVDPDGKTLEF
ncbi:MAG: hypothetical protein ACOX2R_00500 [Anaerolineae bacterium]|jgi:hypothetical protein